MRCRDRREQRDNASERKEKKEKKHKKEPKAADAEVMASPEREKKEKKHKKDHSMSSPSLERSRSSTSRSHRKLRGESAPLSLDEQEKLVADLLAAEQQRRQCGDETREAERQRRDAALMAALAAEEERMERVAKNAERMRELSSKLKELATSYETHRVTIASALAPVKEKCVAHLLHSLSSLSCCTHCPHDRISSTAVSPLTWRRSRLTAHATQDREAAAGAEERGGHEGDSRGHAVADVAAGEVGADRQGRARRGTLSVRTLDCDAHVLRVLSRFCLALT